MPNGANETNETNEIPPQPGERGFQQTMSNLMGGFDFGDIYSPAEQFRQFAGGQFTPGLMRNAFYNMQAPLTQQYLLSAAGMPQGIQGMPAGAAGGGFAPGGSFANFLGNYNPGYNLPGMGTTSTIQRQPFMSLVDAINQYGMMTPQAQQAYYERQGTPGAEGYGVGTSGISFNPMQQALFRQQYGMGTETGLQNRQALANMLALQKGGETGGQYGGILGQAIQGMLQDMYTQYQGAQAEAKAVPTDYLDWYLSSGAPRFGGQL